MRSAYQTNDSGSPLVFKVRIRLTVGQIAVRNIAIVLQVEMFGVRLGPTPLLADGLNRSCWSGHRANLPHVFGGVCIFAVLPQDLEIPGLAGELGVEAFHEPVDFVIVHRVRTWSGKRGGGHSVIPQMWVGDPVRKAVLLRELVEPLFRPDGLLLPEPVLLVLVERCPSLGPLRFPGELPVAIGPPPVELGDMRALVPVELLLLAI